MKILDQESSENSTIAHSKITDFSVLKTTRQKVLYLGKHYDPYTSDNPMELVEMLKELDLDPKKLDPFTITNKLLQLIDRFQEDKKIH